MAEIGSVLDNKYRILDQVGKGGMSVVYLARDKRLEKLWAIKEIRNVDDPIKRKTIIDSLKLEARLMKDLDHPAIVRIVDIIDEKSSLFVVMDYIDGSDLTSHMYPNGKKAAAVPIEEEQAIAWAIEICDVLRYLHAQTPPIIYYDLKPDNVMVRNEGDIRLIDFGAARRYNPDPNKMNKMKILGTMGYAAPEQYKRPSETDIRTDIYTFGMTLHYMVTGQVPKATRENTNPRPRPIREFNPKLSSGLEMIINRCTQPKKEDRYQNCEELMYALEHYKELDEKYKARQRKTLKKFVTAAGISIGLLALSGISALVNVITTNNNYNAQVAAGNYEQAIEIKGNDSEAYIKLIDNYAASNGLQPEEYKKLEGLFANNQPQFNVNGTDYLDLNYAIGTAFLFNCADEEGDSDFNTGVLKAKQYFLNIVGEDGESNQGYEKYEAALSLHNLCDFYGTYSSNSGTKEPTKSTFQNFLSNCEKTLDAMDQYAASAGQDDEQIGYTQAALYNGLMGQINSNTGSMINKGISSGEIEGTVKKILVKNNDLEATVSLDKTTYMIDDTKAQANAIKDKLSSLAKK